MGQISFSDAEYAGKRKKTRREVFFEEMEQFVTWKSLLSLIEPHYPMFAPRPQAVSVGVDAARAPDAWAAGSTASSPRAGARTHWSRVSTSMRRWHRVHLDV
jgi:hypothetical protein